MMYSSPSGCPFCDDDTNTYIPNQQPPNQQSNDQENVFRSNVNIPSVPSNDPTTYEPTPIEEEYAYEPRNYIICPNINCLEKNPRSNSHCKKCGTSLPIHDTRLENITQDKRINQLIDPRAKLQYFRLGLHLFISKLIGKEKKVRCNNLLKDGSQCDQILGPLDKECPKCGRRHAYYPCVNCGNLLPISSMNCRCGNPSYLSDATMVIEGKGEGEGADSIIDDLQSTFDVSLKTQAISSFAPQQDITNSKFRLESIARQLKSTFDLLGDYLTDFMVPNKKNKMKDSFSVMYQGNQGVMQLNQIGSPIPSERIQSIIADRQRQIQEANDRNSGIDPTQNDDTRIIPPHPAPLQNNDDEMENDPWGDTSI